MQTLSAIPVASPTGNRTSNSGAVHGNYVLLRADGLRLVLPQRDVRSTDYMATRPVRMNGQDGLLHVPDSTDAAVYVAVSAGMQLLEECPSDRFISTVLQGLDVHWCWSEVRVLLNAELHPLPLPVSMIAPGTPVREVVAVGGEWAYICSAEMLQQFALTREG
jgi:hypothetical protein